MRIHVLDPGLTTVTGHHLDLDRLVARQLVSEGHEVAVHAHRQISPEAVSALESIAPVHKTFRALPYAKPHEVDVVAGEHLLYIHDCASLAQDLARLPPADLWLWPSLFAAQLHACALAGGKTPVSGCVHVPPNSVYQPTGAAWWRQAFLAAHGAKMSLRVGAMEPEHRYDFLPLTVDRRFAILPCPYEGSPIEEPRTVLRTVGFFGHQRSEKGGQLIPRLVSKLVAMGYRIILHNSHDRRLFPDHPMVTHLGHVNHLPDEIVRCDLVILPYDPVQYRRKGSGILWESMASGIPVIAPFDTAPGRWVERTGSGELFCSLTEPEILRAFQTAAADYPRLAQAAFDAAQAWKQTHGVPPFVRSMIVD